MELRDLRYFVMLAEHQNIGRAAEALDLSATALGKSLRRLEKSMGAKLTQRAPKGVALTAVGAVLLNRIGPLEGMLKDVRREAADLTQGYAGHINVGANQAAAENVIADACVALSRETSRVTLKVTIANFDFLRTALRKGEMDFCVARPRPFLPAEFVCERLYETQDIIFASAHHHLAKRKQVSIEELVGERWASITRTSDLQWQTLFRAFEKSGLPLPSVALDTNSPVMRIQAIAYSDYLSLTSRQFLRQEARKFPLIELPVKEFTLANTMSIIYRKGAYLSPATKRLIDILKAQAGEMSDGGQVARMK